MLQDISWIRVLVKFIVNVTLDHDFIVVGLLTEETWEVSVVAESVACKSLVTHCFVIAILSEHQEHKN